VKFAAALSAALLVLLPSAASADRPPCLVNPEICVRIDDAYRQLEDELGRGERAIRDLVSPVLPSCTADVTGVLIESSFVMYVSTERNVQLAEYSIRGANNGTCPAEYHEPPSSPEGTAICTVFVFGDVGAASGADSDVDGNCLAEATTFEIPVAATVIVEGYTFGDAGVLPGHDIAYFEVDCLPSECVAI